VDLFTNLFDTSDFDWRWDCGLWIPAHGWLHSLSDLEVWSAYLAIPAVIGFFGARNSGFSARNRMTLATQGESQHDSLDLFFSDGSRENCMSQGSTR
jgi:hypothetical protein